jgi:hypothetical protein
MNEYTDVMPTEADIEAVQDRLASLYAELPPGQQAVLEMIIASGLSMVNTDDTSGYGLEMPGGMDIIAQARVDELRHEWRRVNSRAHSDEPRQQQRRGGMDLRPILAWFNRPQPRPAT